MRLTAIEVTAANILRNRCYIRDHQILTPEVMRYLIEVERGAPWQYAYTQASFIWEQATYERMANNRKEKRERFLRRDSNRHTHDSSKGSTDYTLHDAMAIT